METLIKEKVIQCLKSLDNTDCLHVEICFAIFKVLGSVHCFVDGMCPSEKCKEYRSKNKIWTKTKN